MTAEKLHDAIGLLPSDLIAETDAKRSRRPKVIQWRRYAAMAACLALIFYGGLLFRSRFLPGFDAAKEAPAEAAAAPAAVAPQSAEDVNEFEYEKAPAETQAAADRLEAPAAEDETCALPTVSARENSAAEDTEAGSASQSASATDDQPLCIDHSHLPAESFEDTEGGSGGWCGNMTATVYLSGEAHSLSGSDAVTLTDILFHLDYDPAQLCRCMAQFTADTEMGTGYEINLTEFFVRYSGGQAALTTQQADALREIIEALGE